MSKPKTTPPHEVFALMQSWWALQTGFGLLYLFSDDALALNWLRERTQEEVVHTPHAQMHGLHTFKRWEADTPPPPFFAPPPIRPGACIG